MPPQRRSRFGSPGVARLQNSRCQHLTSGCMAASRVASYPCVTSRSSWKAKLITHIHGVAAGAEFNSEMRPTICPPSAMMLHTRSSPPVRAALKARSSPRLDSGPQNGRFHRPIRGATWPTQSCGWSPRCTATKARSAIPLESYHAQ